MSRPPRRTWPDAPIHHGVRVLILLAVAAPITALFPPIQQVRVRSFELGTVAEDDEVARLSFNVPKTSEELVNDRAEARGSVPPTFKHLSAAADTMAARLARFFSRVDSARVMDDTIALHEVLRATSVAVQPVQVSLLDEDWVFDVVRRTALRATREILPIGVADNSQLQGIYTDNITIRQIGGGSESAGGEVVERSVPTSEVLGSRTFLERAVGLLPADASPDVQEILRLILIQYIEFSYRRDEETTGVDQDAAARFCLKVAEQFGVGHCRFHD